MNQNKSFKLFSNCIPVKGFNRSVLCDLQRNDLKLIPNDLYDILKNHEGKTIEEIKSIFKHEYNDIIDEYFEFLIKNETIFFTDNSLLFPKLSLQWDESSTISNAIIDVDINSKFNITDVLDQLNNLCCKYIEIRYFRKTSLIDLVKVLQYLNDINSTIISIDFILPSNNFPLEEIKDLLNQYTRISSLKIYSHDKNVFIPPQRKSNLGYVIFTEKEVNSKLHCGEITQQSFAVNISLFTEAQCYNTCLNKKIGIDSKGEIKNCPSMSKSFGNIESTKLESALAHKDFMNLWKISKDQIDTCKDCEFRYICTDCRAYIENPDNEHSKPLKCGYNPYTNEWNDWGTNKLNEKTIKSYQLEETLKGVS